MKSRRHFWPGWLFLIAGMHWSFLGVPPCLADSSSPRTVEFRNGDLVLFLGDTLMEREQEFGHLEERITAQYPGSRIRFRNLAWSGDTPRGEARSSFDFDKPGKGREKLMSQIAEVQPTVVVLGYGMASSLEKTNAQPEMAGIKFERELEALITSITKVVSNAPVRFILLGPVYHAKLRPPWPDPSAHNARIDAILQASKRIASHHRIPFISLASLPGKLETTRNGIHLSDYGYEEAARLFASQCGWSSRLPLTPGQREALRVAIVKKNSLCFDRYRPQNETYLFGFRKYEQGQNAREIPMFDRLIAEQESVIFNLSKNSQARPVRQQGAEPREINQEITRQESARRLAEMNFEVAPGFQVNLFAESPLLAKPIQINFDERGRLWIASSEVYPQVEPGQQANDKIIVLEDANHDGYAEKSHVFADGLLIPTAVVPGDGGAYVGQGTELLHFRDSRGTGRANQKQIVLSGFGTEDTHHMVHTLRWGFDGELYFNQSIYIHTHLETPWDLEELNSGGVWRMRTENQRLNVYLRGFCNPWGHAFDEFGQSFLTDGAGGQGINYGLPGATFFTYASMRRELKGISPGSYPKFCGLEIIRSPQFPKAWQGSAITCDFRAHRIVRFDLEEKGAGFAAHETLDLLRTTNVTFRPIDVKLGPDGALYIADWSNPIIQHGEVDFRDKRRDHEHGRIWRVTAVGRPLPSRPNLAKAGIGDLLNFLVSPNDFDQSQARRLLRERGVKILPQLRQWEEKQTSEYAVLQALWIHQALDNPNVPLLKRSLKATDGRIRAAATRVAGAWQEQIPGGEALLTQLLQDAHPRVKLEAVRALGVGNSATAASAVLSLVNGPMDEFLEYAEWLTINELARPWTAAITNGTWEANGHEKELEYGLSAIEPAIAASVINTVGLSKPIPSNGKGPWIELIGKSGNIALLGKLFDQLVSGGFADAAAIRVLNALSDAAIQRQLKPAGDLGRLKAVMTTSKGKTLESSFKLAGAWKASALAPEIARLSRETGSKNGFDALRDIGGEPAEQLLAETVTAEGSVAMKRHAVVALASLNLQKAVDPALGLLNQMNGDEAALFWRDFLAVKNAGPALANAIAKTNLPPEITKAGLKVAQEGGRNEKELIKALNGEAANATVEKELGPDDLKQLAAKVMAQGDPARGERIFRRKELACLTCHAIGGVGGKVGPDMTSIGASAQPDYLVESVLYPNRKIKEGYHSVLLETSDGLELSGIIVKEDPDKIVLRDATDKETTVPKSRIQKRSQGGSLMPSGLVDLLPEADRLDLYRFLAELGKPGPFDASRPTVARAWKLFPETVDVAQFGDDKNVNSDLSAASWQTYYTLTDGRLERSALTDALHTKTDRFPQAIFAATQFQTAKDGPVILKIEGAKDTLFWVDGQSQQLAATPTVKLKAGSHRLVIKLNAKSLPDALRVSSAEAGFTSF